MQGGEDTCGPAADAACFQRLPDGNGRRDDRGGRPAGSGQDQEAPDVSVAGAGSKQLAAADKACADAVHTSNGRAGDHQLQRDVSPADTAAGQSAFAAQAGSLPEFGTSAGSDAGGFMRPRGVEAMMGGGQQRRTPSGALLSPSGMSDHGGLLTERATSSGSTHRALMGAVSPSAARCGAAAAAAPAGAAGLLELPEGAPNGSSASSDTSSNTALAAASASQAAQPSDCAQQQQEQQQQAQQPATSDFATAAGAAAAAAAAAGGAGAAARMRPADLLIPSPAATYFAAPMVSPASGLVHPYGGAPIPIDEIDLDAIDGTPSVDACGLSTSSSPTISGVGVGRSTPSHLRSSRDHDLRRMAAINQMMSPSMQQHAAHITAAPGSGAGSRSGGPVISIFPEGAQVGPQMFTGPTRSRALPGSSNSLHSVGSGTEQSSSTEPPSEVAAQFLSMRLAQQPAGSPARPRSATAAAGMPPRAGSAGASRGSSAAGSPVPPPTHGHAAALLAGSVVASPRTPHSPLSVILSPRASSVRVLAGQGTPLPGPLFGSGFNSASALAGPSPGTSPGTSSVAAPSSTASSCCTAASAGAAAPAGQPPAGAGGRSSSVLSSAGAAQRRFASPSPTAGMAGGSQPPTQTQTGEAAQPPTQMQQHLRQQLQLHDTRLGPHGGSPLSPSHHHQQLPPRGDTLLSPSCPTPLVPPALTSAASHHRQLADGAAAAGALPASAGNIPVGRPAGGVGHVRIHEWLDHQSWRLPYEVPQGLRDAADLREAAAQEQQHAAQQQQLQQQSRMGPGSSRVSSQQNSYSNLDSPLGGVMLHPGASPAFGSTGRWPAGAGSLAGGAGLPPPALHSILHQQQTPPGSDQHHEHHLQHHQQDHPGGERPQGAAAHQWDGLSPTAIQNRAALAHLAAQARQQRGQPASPGAHFGDGDLSVGASGPLSSAQLPVHAALIPAGAVSAPGAAPLAGQAVCDWQQRQHQHQLSASPLAPPSNPPSSSNVGPRPISRLGLYAWPDAADSTPMQLSGGAAPTAAGDGALCGCDAPMQGPHAACQARGAAVSSPAQHTGDTPAGCRGNSSSCCQTACQLGAGSHLFPGYSPGCSSGRSGSCCCQQQAHGDGSCSTPSRSGAAAWHGAPLALGDSRQPAADPTSWQQLRSPPMSPAEQFAGAAAAADAGRQRGLSDQDVLPGIAQLLQRRSERHQQQQRLQEQLGANRQAAGQGAGGSSYNTTVGLSSPPGCPAMLAGARPAVTGATVCSSEGSPAKRSKTAAAAAQCSRGDSGDCCCTRVTLAELLHDRRFVARVLCTLPGVDPQSDLVWETVAELQQALPVPTTHARQQPEQQ